MKTWIALLRGINIGGHHKLPMKELRDLLTGLGYRNVQTYGQSGNCVFRSKEKSPEKMGIEIADAVEAAYGFKPKVFVLTLDILKAAIRANPFKEATEMKSVHLLFLEGEPEEIDLEGLKSHAKPSEEIFLKKKVLYLHTPEGSGRSKMVEKIPKYVPAGMTGRNLRTVKEVVALATAADC